MRCSSHNDALIMVFFVTFSLARFVLSFMLR